MRDCRAIAHSPLILVTIKGSRAVLLDYSDDLIAAAIYTTCIQLTGPDSACVDLSTVISSLPFKSPERAVQSLLDQHALTDVGRGQVWLCVADEDDLRRAISLVVMGYPLLVADDRDLPSLADLLDKVIAWHRQLFPSFEEDSPVEHNYP